MRAELSKKLLLLTASLAFALTLIEAMFRLVGYAQGIDYRLYLKELKNSDRLPRALFRADPQTTAALAPNTEVLAVTSDFSVIYRTNSKGLRDQEYAYEKPQDRLRILALGDSITFGEGVPYGARFTDIPEDELDGLEIINASVPGWGLDSELVYLAREGLRYAPDWVVIFINFVGLTRELPGLVRDGRVELSAQPPLSPRNQGVAGGGDTWYLRPDDPMFKERSVLTRSSYALSYLTFRVNLAQRRGALEQQDAARWQQKNAGRRTPDVTTDLPEASPRVRLVLEKFVELSKANGFRLMIINISSWASLSFVPTVDPSIVYHDLAPLLVAESRKRPISFKYDPHYTPETNRLLGRELVNILRPLVEEHRAQPGR
ncbi:MAG TPA: SGNH/GDSL hydrolase family protein [Candidatus Limnocylindrales bacterium]|nr:SGNH/GDSL hydrolase family protein [Candidatus Limnocylindrales bacterium]